jgi:hypothetical protein
VGNQEHRSTTIDEHCIRESVKPKHLAVFFRLNARHKGSEPALLSFDPQVASHDNLNSRRAACHVKNALPIANGACYARKEPFMSQNQNRKTSKLFVGVADLLRHPSYHAVIAIPRLVAAFVLVSTRTSRDARTQAQAQRTVSQYSGTFTSPASCCSSEAPGGPLMGNGNLGVVVINPINAMIFLLGKKEFWSLAGGKVEPMASMSLSIPNMSGTSFAMQENIYTGTGQFVLNGNHIQTI